MRNTVRETAAGWLCVIKSKAISVHVDARSQTFRSIKVGIACGYI